MTSQRKIQANQSNSRKSSGPRTSKGKQTSSRNSRKHGLASIDFRQPANAAEIERLVKALCGDDQDPALLRQARIFAESDLVLRVAREQKLAVIERLREATAVPFVKGNNAPAQADARLQEAKRAERKLNKLIPPLVAKYRDQLPPSPDWFPIFDRNESVVSLLKDLLKPPHPTEGEKRKLEPSEQQNQPAERDEYEALEMAAPDLVRLERYERRAWSQQKRAIRKFMNIKLIRNLGHPLTDAA
jgi:hypothetical protein